jgi:hypothetical protein
LLEDRVVPAAVDVWTGANHLVDSNWSDSANWSLQATPGKSDTVQFDNTATSFTSIVDSTFTVAVVNITSTWGDKGGRINVDSDLIATGNFTLAGGMLTGPANVTVSGMLTWNGGTMAGTGHTKANGGMTLDTHKYLTLYTRTIDNAGAATWTSGNANLTADNGAIWNNEAGSSLDLQGNDPFLWGAKGRQPQFNNAGLLEMSGTGSTQFDPMLTNNIGGTVDVNSGDLTFDGGDGGASHGSFSHGSFSVAVGSTLTFAHNPNFALSDDSFTLSSDSSVSGAGTVQINGVTVNVGCDPGNYTVTATVVQNTTTGNGIANLISNETLSSLTLQNGGTLTGPANVTVSGMFTWNGGTLDGAQGSRLEANGGMNLITKNYLKWNRRIIDNAGLATWTSGGANLTADYGAVWNNLNTNSTLNMVGYVHGNDPFLWGLMGDQPQFYNAGLLEMSGTASTQFDPRLVNNIGTVNGTVEVNSGDLTFDGGDGGASLGSFSVAAGSTLTFFHNGNLKPHNDSFTFSSDSSVSGAGTVQINGVTVNVMGGYTVTATTVQNGNTTNGIANFSSNVTLNSLTLTNGGTLTGTGNVTVNGLLTWSWGTMSGTGLTTVAPGATLSINDVDVYLDVRTINNRGKATWTGQGNVIIGQNGAVINNLPGASWDFQSDAYIGGVAGTLAGTFNNTGTMKKTKGTGQTTVNTSKFNNTGRLEVHTGTVNVTGAVSQVSGSRLTAGSWAVFGSATVSATLTISSPSSIDTIGSKASVILSGLKSTFTNIDTTLTTILAGGSFTLSNGRTYAVPSPTVFSNAGSVILSGGTLNLNGTVSQLSGTSLTGGTWTVNAKSTLNFPTGSTITSLGPPGTPLAGAHVTLSGSSSNFAAITDLAMVRSKSTFSLLGGRSFTTLGPLTNEGSITLSPASVLTVSGSFTQQSGATLNIQMGGTANAPTIGTIVSTSGTVTLDGSLHVTSTVQPTVKTSFDILMNDGNSPISGMFAGLAEGQHFTVKVGSASMTFTITYKGGAGNDVVITQTA